MNTKKIGLALLLMPLVFSIKAQAQGNKKDNDKKTERIIITQKNGPIEKMTIEVNGDKVSINGKPAAENKDVDITIMKDSDGDMFMKAPSAPGMLFGMPFGEENMNGNGNFFFNNNNRSKTFLGVMSEANKDGARITDVTEKSGADSAGLKEGDIITKVGDTKIANPSDLSAAIGKYNPNDKVNITYSRDGKTSTTTATLHAGNMRVFAWKDLDNLKGFSMPGMPKLDGLQDFDFFRSKVKLGAQVQDMEDNSGVKILNAEKDGAVEKAGIQNNDVISKINDTKISSVDDLRNMLKTIKEGDTIQLTYIRNNNSKTVSIKFPKELKTMDL
ncbi:MAG: PDZ domain-containing protein [Chitinophagaceae bacterium]